MKHVARGSWRAEGTTASAGTSHTRLVFVSGTLVSSAQRADVEGVTLARKLSAQRGGQGEHVPFPQEGLATPEEQGGGLKQLHPTGATT